MTEHNIVDDGTLACLNIPRDEKNRSFNCDETTQSKLVKLLIPKEYVSIL